MNFFKTLLASTLGFIIGSVISMLIFFAIVGGIIGSISEGSSSSDQVVKKHTILKIDLAGDIRESAKPAPFDLPSDIPLFSGMDKMGLYQFRQALEHAKEDKNVDGILIRPSMSTDAGWASLIAIREAIEDFKTSGKFVYAYAEGYSEKGYYIATMADSILLYPEGGMEWNGFASTPMFFRGMLDKLEVEPEIFRVGTFKSAVEPFMLKEMSEASRKQTQEFLNDMWTQFASDVAKSRKIDVAVLNQLADSMTIHNPADALKARLVDRLAYEDEVYSLLMSKTEGKKVKDLNFMTVSQYMRSPAYKLKKSKGDSEKKVALIFAEGNIIDGKGEDGTIGSASLAATIREAREDENVKAVVMRVNSPGGSALASDVIWREVIKTKEAGKPFYISMGDVAASGGYYISAAADRIYAEPNTITGSIGVLGVMFNTGKFMENKIGLTFDRVTTHKHADLGNPNRVMEQSEHDFIQSSVEDVYGTFINVVKNGRGFKDSLSVDSIAQGRVWSGVDALGIGLVDELGGLDDAIKGVVAKAALGEDYKVQIYGQPKDPFEELFGSFMQSMADGKAISPELAEEIRLYKQVKAAITQSGVYAIMPVDYDIR